MNSMDEYYLSDQRILGALRHNLEGSDSDSFSQRSRLAALSWNTVDVAREHGFYCEVITFPGWENSDDMLDFGWMHGRYDISGLDTFCFRLKGSPIADSVELTEKKLLGGTSLNFDSLRQIAPLSMLRDINAVDLQNEIFSDERVRVAYLESQFAQCLMSIFCGDRIQSGFLLSTESFGDCDIQRTDAERACLLFWLAAFLYPDEEFALEIVRAS